MSIVAGCSMLDGVLLAADCRVTLKRPGLPEIHMDCAQKLFTLTDETSFGFVGDVGAATHLLRALEKQFGRHRKDAFSLGTWLPRLFRHEFAKYPSNGTSQGVAFMVGQVLKGRPNRIKRAEVANLFKHIRSDKHPLRRNSYPAWIISILAMQPQREFICIEGTHRAVLYSMRSPNFNIETYDTFAFPVIGSGEISKTYLARVYDMIVAGQDETDLFFMRQAIRDCVKNEGIHTVGGMYPALKISGEGTTYFGEAVQLYDGTQVELDCESGQWVQRNLSTGKEIRLVPPNQISANESKSREFNDVDDKL